MSMSAAKSGLSPKALADVWIVDDEDNHTRALRKLLKTAQEQDPSLFGGGIEIRGFDKSEKAIRELSAAKPERRPLLIIADVMMPWVDDGAFRIHQELQAARYNGSRPYLLWTSARDSVAWKKAEDTLASMLGLPFWDRWARYFEKPPVVPNPDGEGRLDSESWVTLVDDLIRRQRHLDYRALWRNTRLEALDLPTHSPWRDFRAAMLRAKTAPLVILRGPSGTPFRACAEWLGRLRCASDGVEPVSGTLCRTPGVAKSELFGTGENDMGAVHRARTGTLLLTGFGRNGAFGGEVLPRLAELLQGKRFRVVNSSTPLTFAGTVIFGVSDHEWCDSKSNEVIRELAELATRQGAPTITVPGLEAFPKQAGLLANQLLLAASEGKKCFGTEAKEMISERDWPGGLEDLQGFVVRCSDANRLSPIGLPAVRKILGARIGGGPLPSGFGISVDITTKTARVTNAQGKIHGDCPALSFERGERGGWAALPFLYFLTMLEFEPKENGSSMTAQVGVELEETRKRTDSSLFNHLGESPVNASTAALDFRRHTENEPFPWNWEYWKEQFQIGANGVQPWIWPAGSSKATIIPPLRPRASTAAVPY